MLANRLDFPRAFPGEMDKMVYVQEEILLSATFSCQLLLS